MASEPILLSTALYYLLKEEKGWLFTLNLLKWDTGITGSTNKLPVRDRTLAQPHRCDAVLPTYKPSWANSLSSSFNSALLWPEKWENRLIGLENEMASNWWKELVHFKSAHVQLIVRVTEFGMKSSSFSPGCQHILMQSHLYQLWKGGQRRRTENQISVGQALFPHVPRAIFRTKEILGLQTARFLVILTALANQMSQKGL